MRSEIIYILITILLIIPFQNSYSVNTPEGKIVKKIYKRSFTIPVNKSEKTIKYSIVKRTYRKFFTIEVEKNKNDIGRNTPSIQIYPHPASSFINFNLDTDISTGAVIKIFDIYGNIQYESERYVNAGNNNISIDINGFIEGHYCLIINIGNTIYNSNFIINH